MAASQRATFLLKVPPSDGREDASFTWLHLTDLHAGQAAHYLWPTVEAKVIEDLRHLHDRLGRVDALFFTGDLVQGGTADQLALFDGMLGRIREELAQLGSHPTLLAIPGNHDLERPDPHGTAGTLADVWDRRPDLREHFWTTPTSEQRVGAAGALAAWSAWWDLNRPSELRDHAAGALPGDYRGTLQVGGRRIGVLALNSTFLQLRGGPLDVTVDARQLYDTLADGGLPVWAQQHDLVLLLTHHPPAWLDERGRRSLVDDYLAPGLVSVHLCGHQHLEETLAMPFARPPRVTLLGRSLFGLERFEHEGTLHERVHGYQAGQVRFADNSRRLRLWARLGVHSAESGWEIKPDPHFAPNEGTDPPMELGASPREARAHRERLSAPVPPSPRSRLSGWIRLTPAVLAAKATPLTPEELGRYYDGAMPNWSHAVDREGVPHRTIVDGIVAQLVDRDRRGTPTVALVVGPGAEGKSTVLLQSAARMVAQRDRWKVLWRPGPDVGLDAEQVAKLPPGPWVLVVDDADQVAAQLGAAHALCAQHGRRDIHFLLAARDTDWTAARGDRPAWGSALVRFPMRDLDPQDARAVVRAWQRLGEAGLRELAAVHTEDDRVARLLEIAQSSDGARPSFFGAVLHTRFTAADLRAHVQAVMNRLEERDADGTLRRAFVATALCDTIGIGGIDRTVLADLLHVARKHVSTEVVRPLGQEAASTQAGQLVRVRHRDIARAVVAIAERSGVDEDLGELCAAIARQTIVTHRRQRLSNVRWLSGAIHMGPRLIERLPKTDFGDARRLEIAIRAAETAYEANEERPLTCAVTLAATWRAGGRADEGRRFLASIAPKVVAWPEHEQVVSRSFYFEWAVCAGEDGDPVANIALGAYCLSDHLNPVKIELDNARRGIAGLGLACLEARGRIPEDTRLRAVAACSFLGTLTNPDMTAIAHFARHAREAARGGFSPPADMDEAFAWIAVAVATAAAALNDDDARALPGYDKPAFAALRAALAPDSAAEGVPAVAESST